MVLSSMGIVMMSGCDGSSSALWKDATYGCARASSAEIRFAGLNCGQPGAQRVNVSAHTLHRVDLSNSSRESQVGSWFKWQKPDLVSDVI